MLTFFTLLVLNLGFKIMGLAPIAGAGSIEAGLLLGVRSRFLPILDKSSSSYGNKKRDPRPSAHTFLNVKNI